MTGSYIYKITSPSGKIYIGQTRNLYNRKYKYKNLLCRAQPKLYHSLKKHGFSAHVFEILCDFPNNISQTVLDSAEIFFIGQYKNDGFEMLNLRNGGSRGKLSRESIEKMRIKLRETINTPEYKAKVSALRKGKKLSPEHLEKLRRPRNKKYPPKSAETRRKLSVAHTGKKYGPRTEEQRRRMSQAQMGHKGRILTHEEIEKFRLRIIGRKQTPSARARIKAARSIPILQLDKAGNLIAEWPSAKEACLNLKLGRARMCNVLKGANNNFYKDHKWIKKTA